jgi:hypothetical protein
VGRRNEKTAQDGGSVIAGRKNQRRAFEATELSKSLQQWLTSRNEKPPDMAAW